MKPEHKKLLDDLAIVCEDLKDDPIKREIIRRAISTIVSLAFDAEQADIDTVRALHERNELRKLLDKQKN